MGKQYLRAIFICIWNVLFPHLGWSQEMVWLHVIDEDPVTNRITASCFHDHSLLLASAHVDYNTGYSSYSVKFLDAPTGTVKWKLSGAGRLNVTSIVRTSDGWVFCGSYGKNVTFFGSPVSSSGASNAFIASVSDDGVILWSRHFECTGVAEIRALHFDDDTNTLFAVGHFSENLFLFNDEIVTGPKYNPILIALYPSGDLKWHKVPLVEAREDVVTDNVGASSAKITVTGKFIFIDLGLALDTYVEWDQEQMEGKDYYGTAYLLKLNKEGEALSSSLSATGNERVTFMQSAGERLLSARRAGWTSWSNSTYKVTDFDFSEECSAMLFTGPYGGPRFAGLHLTPDHLHNMVEEQLLSPETGIERTKLLIQKQDLKTKTTVATDLFFADKYASVDYVHFLDNDQVIIAGRMKDSLTLGSSFITGKSGYSTFAARIKVNYKNDVTFIAKVQDQELLLHPNPAQDHVLFNGNAEYHYNLLSSNGQLESSGTANGGEKIDLTGINNGFYMLELRNQEETRILKFIIQR